MKVYTTWGSFDIEECANRLCKDTDTCLRYDAFVKNSFLVGGIEEDCKFFMEKEHNGHVIEVL